MKHLKAYESLFEETLSDICLDLTDEGFVIEPCTLYTQGSSLESNKTWGIEKNLKVDIYFLSIRINNFDSYNRNVGFDLGEISDTLQRIKNFLGDRFHHFSYSIGIDVHNTLGLPNPSNHCTSAFVWYVK